MWSFLKQAVSSAAIVFSALKVLLGNAQYADVGIGQVSVDLLTQLLPAVAAFAIPIISAKWPKIASILTLIYNAFKYRSAETASVLSKTAALEAYADQVGCAEMRTACATIRDNVLKSVKSAEKAPAPAVK